MARAEGGRSSGLLAKAFKMVDYLKPASTADNRNNLVTVDDLLTHRGGWDRDQSFDVMFRDEIIADSRNLNLPITGTLTLLGGTLTGSGTFTLVDADIFDGTDTASS